MLLTNGSYRPPYKTSHNSKHSIMHHCNVTVVFIKFLKTTISYACKLKLASYDVGFQNLSIRSWRLAYNSTFRKRGSVTAKSILPIQMTKSRVSGGDLRVCSVKYSHLFQKRLWRRWYYWLKWCNEDSNCSCLCSL